MVNRGWIFILGIFLVIATIFTQFFEIFLFATLVFGVAYYGSSQNKEHDIPLFTFHSIID
jgi:hypothetical protein